MKRWTIRWRLTIWNTMILTALFCVICALMLSAVHRHLKHLADQVMQEELRELIEELRSANDEQVLVAQLTPRYSVHSHFHFQILDGHNRVLFRSRFLTHVDLPRTIAGIDSRGPQYEDIELGEMGGFRLLSTAIRNSRSEPLLLQVVSPRAALRQEFQWYLVTVFGALPIAILVSIMTGYLLARHALHPLDQMASTAEKISTEELDHLLNVENPHDELGRLAKTLNGMFDRIRVTYLQMRQFTSDAAHELRSPIAALKTQSEVTLCSTRSVDEYQSVVRDTLDEANHMSQLVDQLLLLSRHDSGQDQDEFNDVRVDLLLLDVIDRIRPNAERNGLRLRVWESPEWVVQGDDIWISQLFWNLVDNAVKYTSSGGEIEVKACMDGDHWKLTVRDTGIGIAAQYLPRVFDRFFRVDRSRSRHSGGTGLGLAICKSIVGAHRGSISASSELGVGTEFEVRLPGRPTEVNIDRIPQVSLNTESLRAS